MEILELFIAALGAWILGSIWYTFLFGKIWQAESGVTDEQAQSGMVMTHGLAFVMMIITAFGINYIIGLHAVEDQTFVHGAFHGAHSCLLYGLPLMIIHYLYQKKSFKLMAIDGLYALAFFALEGGILAALKLGA